MQWFIIGLLAIVSLVLYAFNQEPVTLYFLGNSPQSALISLSLPLGAWVILAILSGLLNGLLVRLFIQLSSPSSLSRRPRQQSQPPSPRPSRPDRNGSEQEWEGRPSQEWDIEEPPVKPTEPQYSAPKPIQPEIKDRFSADDPIPRQKSPDTLISPEFEVSQKPRVTSQEGSVYRYTYTEKTKPTDSSKTNRSPSVYDANYRVIDPPSVAKEDQDFLEDDAEDWV